MIPGKDLKNPISIHSLKHLQPWGFIHVERRYGEVGGESPEKTGPNTKPKAQMGPDQSQECYILLKLAQQCNSVCFEKLCNVT